MQIVSWRQFALNVKAYVPEKRKENIVYLSSAHFVQVVVKVKSPIFLKNKHFIVQERFHILILSFNTIITCDI